MIGLGAFPEAKFVIPEGLTTKIVILNELRARKSHGVGRGFGSDIAPISSLASWGY
jgi:hypothetical protein